jgi:hypothetical protein
MMIAAKGGGTEGEAANWLDVVVRTFILELSQGRSVNIKGFVTANVNIKGTFPYPDSSFDPLANKLRVSISPSRAITNAIKDSPVNRVSDASSGLYIEHVHDVASDTTDSVLTPGMVLKIYGSKMKIAGDAPNVGVAFIDAEGAETLVPMTAVSRNGDREIDLVLPSLSAGAYTVQVTTMSSGSSGTHLVAARSFTFPTVLTVGGGT